MVPARRRLLVALVVFSAMLMAPAALAIHEPTAVSPGPGPQGSPRTDGVTVVWSDGREGVRFSTDVYGARLTDRQEFPIATGAANQMQPDVDGDLVVWSEDGIIRGKNLATGDEFAISSGPEDSLPAIWGQWVVWVSLNDLGYSLYGRDLGTMAEPILLADLQGTIADRPEIDGQRVLWGEADEGDGATPASWRLLTIRADGTDRQVVAEDAGTGAFLGGYDLHGDVVVYVRGDQLTAVDIATGEQRVIASQSVGPVSDGRYVFWSDTRYPLDGDRVDLWGYDLLSDSRFAVHINRGRNVLLDAGGGYLVWSRGFLPREMLVQAAPMHDLLPSARRPEPSTTSPDWRYFPETGHYVAFGFRAFWERGGGIPVLGYAMTEEFDELNPDLGAFRTVQYFERQRFEYHPEHAGTPYEVLLGRLGAIDAERRGLLDTEPFQPLPAGTTGDANCDFFPQTGHRLCHGFRAYWHRHGLDFGDSGVSFRESLALFGYPISEEYTDLESGLTVQYFERARFEFHPDNPQPYRVLLGRLGADALTVRGW